MTRRALLLLTAVFAALADLQVTGKAPVGRALDHSGFTPEGVSLTKEIHETRSSRGNTARHLRGPSTVKNETTTDSVRARGLGVIPGDMTNWGGSGAPVMVGQVQLFYIFYGTWTTAKKNNLITFANNFGGSNWLGMLATYYSGNGVVGSNVILGGTTTDFYSFGSSLSDAGVLAAVEFALNQNHLPVVSNAIYLLLTSPDVAETSGFCGAYCGWHNHANHNGVDIKYAFVGDPSNCAAQCSWYCDASCSPTPNGDLATDSMVSVIAHEVAEAMSDPDLNAWHDNTGHENADKCAWTFGTVNSPATGGWNVNLNGHHYLLQQNWVNQVGGYCALALPGAPSVTAAVTPSRSFSQTAGATHSLTPASTPASTTTPTPPSCPTVLATLTVSSGASASTPILALGVGNSPLLPNMYCGGVSTGIGPAVEVQINVADVLGGALTINTCNPATTFDTMLFVGGSCAKSPPSFGCLGGNDDYCGLQSQLTIVPVTSSPVYVMVEGWSTSLGQFVLSSSYVPSATATPTASSTGSRAAYVGSYTLGQGGPWTNADRVYSCVEACATVFGGTPTQYACSITPDEATHEAWVDGYGDTSHCPGGTPVADTYDVGLANTTWVLGAVGAPCSSVCSVWQPGSFCNLYGANWPNSDAEMMAINAAANGSCAYSLQGLCGLGQVPEETPAGDGYVCYWGGTTCDAVGGDACNAVPDGASQRFCPCTVNAPTPSPAPTPRATYCHESACVGCAGPGRCASDGTCITCDAGFNFPSYWTGGVINEYCLGRSLCIAAGYSGSNTPAALAYYRDCWAVNPAGECILCPSGACTGVMAAPTTWLLGNPGDSCYTTCTSAGGVCNAATVPWPNSDQDMLDIAAQVGITCPYVSQGACGLAQDPELAGGCFWGGDTCPGGHNCSAIADGGGRRFCGCAVPSQTPSVSPSPGSSPSPTPFADPPECYLSACVGCSESGLCAVDGTCWSCDTGYVMQQNAGFSVVWGSCIGEGLCIANDNPFASSPTAYERCFAVNTGGYCTSCPSGACQSVMATVTGNPFGNPSSPYCSLNNCMGCAGGCYADGSCHVCDAGFTFQGGIVDFSLGYAVWENCDGFGLCIANGSPNFGNPAYKGCFAVDDAGACTVCPSGTCDPVMEYHTTWIFADTNQNCDTACAVYASGGVCRSGHAPWPNTAAEMAAIAASVGVSCPAGIIQGNCLLAQDPEGINGSACYWGGTACTRSCSALPDGSQRRLCPCSKPATPSRTPASTPAATPTPAPTQHPCRANACTGCAGGCFADGSCYLDSCESGYVLQSSYLTSATYHQCTGYGLCIATTNPFAASPAYQQCLAVNSAGYCIMCPSGTCNAVMATSVYPIHPSPFCAAGNCIGCSGASCESDGTCKLNACDAGFTFIGGNSLFSVYNTCLGFGLCVANGSPNINNISAFYGCIAVNSAGACTVCTPGTCDAVIQYDTTWTFAPINTNCDSACAASGRVCSPGHEAWPNSDADMATIAASVGVQCLGGIFQGSCGLAQDPEGVNGGACYWGGTTCPGGDSCSALPDGSERRFCPCNLPSHSATPLPTVSMSLSPAPTPPPYDWVLAPPSTTCAAACAAWRPHSVCDIRGAAWPATQAAMAAVAASINVACGSFQQPACAVGIATPPSCCEVDATSHVCSYGNASCSYGVDACTSLPVYGTNRLCPCVNTLAYERTGPSQIAFSAYVYDHCPSAVNYCWNTIVTPTPSASYVPSPSALPSPSNLCPIAPGARVERGATWSWGDEDGGAGNPGTVISPADLCPTESVWGGFQCIVNWDLSSPCGAAIPGASCRCDHYLYYSADLAPYVPSATATTTAALSVGASPSRTPSRAPSASHTATAASTATRSPSTAPVCLFAPSTPVARGSTWAYGNQDGSPTGVAPFPVGFVLDRALLCPGEVVYPTYPCIVNWPATSPCGAGVSGANCSCRHYYYANMDIAVPPTPTHTQTHTKTPSHSPTKSRTHTKTRSQTPRSRTHTPSASKKAK